MGKPPTSKINDGEIFLIMGGKIDKYLTRAGLTGENWIVDHFDLTLQSNKEIQDVNQKANFSIPFLVETIDSDPTHYRDEIVLAPLQKQDLFFSGSNEPQGDVECPHVAEVMSFYKENGSTKVRVYPIHAYPAKYRVWFQPSNSAPVEMAKNIDFLDSFIELIIVDTSLTGLTQCDWPEPRHSRIEKDLLRDLQQHLETFEIYRLAAYGEDSDNRRSYYGEDRDYDDLLY